MDTQCNASTAGSMHRSCRSWCDLCRQHAHQHVPKWTHARHSITTHQGTRQYTAQRADAHAQRRTRPRPPPPRLPPSRLMPLPPPPPLRTWPRWPWPHASQSRSWCSLWPTCCATGWRRPGPPAGQPVGHPAAGGGGNQPGWKGGGSQAGVGVRRVVWVGCGWAGNQWEGDEGKRLAAGAAAGLRGQTAAWVTGEGRHSR